MKSPAVFLDKDGTLIVDRPHNTDPDRVLLADGVQVALPWLARAGFKLVVITNQAGIAHGFLSEADLYGLAGRLQGLCSRIDAPLDGFYYCPHDPAGTIARYCVDCDCRKPRPGLIQLAAEDLGIDLSRSWFIGDILNDIEAGHAAGCRAILIDNGNETEWRDGEGRTPDFLAGNFAQAARLILDTGSVDDEVVRA